MTDKPKPRPLSVDDVLRQQAKHDVAAYEKARGKVRRNHPCPCGSGRKFKHCCMKEIRDE